MAPYERPLVSVVTPVHNGARYLAECIESVAMQRDVRLEHVIVDNASTDQSRSIARAYARHDPRIRVIAFDEKLPIIGSWNRSLGLAAAESKYVWLLPADDALMVNDTLKRMTAVAESDPRVGVVSCLRMRGGRIECGGLDPDANVFPGREVVRLFLREQVFAFSPTCSLFRRDLIDGARPFYPDRYLHADIAAFFDVMDRVDFGFVHDVLMFSRVHDCSVTATLVNRKGSQFHDGLLILKEFGPRYFSSEELAEVETRFLRRYYRFLVRSAVLLREREFFTYHAEALRLTGRMPRSGALLRALAGELKRAVLRPFLAVEHVRARIHLHENGRLVWDDQPPPK